jgi:hypothetical protein
MQAARVGALDAAQEAAVELYWLPLGAGGHSVGVNGRVFEAAMALAERRPAYDLYHSALEVSLPGARFVIEQTPVPDDHGAARGVVAEGPVGCRWAGRARAFRYEVRRWRDGVIPDIAAAVESPVLISADRSCAQRVLDLAPLVPALVWGRDELAAGEMWNSNSIIAWILERSGLDAASILPPTGGRAPGWRAGLVVARRDQPQTGPDHARPIGLRHRNALGRLVALARAMQRRIGRESLGDAYDLGAK